MKQPTKIALPLIKEFEGLSLIAYPDPLSGGKPYTNGYGSSFKLDGSPWRRGERLSSEKDAENLLISQLEENFLPQLVATIPNWAGLNPWQQAALLAFAYNLGSGFYGFDGFKTISAALLERRYGDVPAALMLYCNPGSKVETGLKRRRVAEGDLWSTATGEPESQPDFSIYNAFRYYKAGLVGQENAIKYLESILSVDQRNRFAELYRDNPASVGTATVDSWLYAHLTGRWLASGMREIRLHLMQGTKSTNLVTAWSGTRSTQDLVHPTKDSQGSLRICPENVYTITGLDDLGYEPAASDAIGRFAITMSPQYRINSRDGLWIHKDGNVPGSAGCLVMNSKDFSMVLAFYREFKPEYCAVNLDFGFLESKGYSLPDV